MLCKAEEMYERMYDSDQLEAHIIADELVDLHNDWKEVGHPDEAIRKMLVNSAKQFEIWAKQFVKEVGA